jgi:UDP-perosamine 4-acetyltransferase
MPNNIIGLGAGGHAQVIIEILKQDKSFRIIGLLDPRKDLWNKKIWDIPVLGDDHLLPEIVHNKAPFFFIGLGSIADTHPRKSLYQKVSAFGIEPVNVIHPQATISETAELGRGVTVMAGAIISAGAFFGENVIINTGAIIDHNCTIGNHVHIATGACLAGTVSVGDCCHIGTGARVIQDIHIGENVTVGAGAVVINNIPSNVTVAGCPAKIIKNKSHIPS